MIDRQPTLHGDHAHLRPLVAADRPALFAVAADPAIWAIHPAHDRWQENVFDDFFDEGLAGGGALAIEDARTGAMIGSSRYGDPDGARIETGWTFLARSHWGGEVNREVKRLMLAHILPQVPTVFFHVGEENMRSRRALEKLGAVPTGEREMVERAGRLVPHVVYAIDRVPD